MKKICLYLVLSLFIFISGCSMAASKNLYKNKSTGPFKESRGPSQYRRTRIKMERSGNKNNCIEIIPGRSSEFSRGRRFRITKENGRITVEALD